MSFDGIITGITLTAANVDERDSLYEITRNIHGLLIGDKGFIRPSLKEDLLKANIDLQTALRQNMSKALSLFNNITNTGLKWKINKSKVLQCTLLNESSNRLK